MKRQRKRWLWAIIAFACVTITFGVAELTGASIITILGWGLLGILGFLAVVSLSVVAVVVIVLPIAFVIKALLDEFISNTEIRYTTLGSLGFCAILVGWILTTRQVWWSPLVIMEGFVLGCLAGVGYHEHSLRVSHESGRVLEQTPDKTRGND